MTSAPSHPRVEPSVRAYAAVLALTTAVVAVAVVATGYGSEFHWALLALAMLAAIGEEGRVQLTARIELSISLLPMLFAAVAFGPLAAMLVAAASLIGEFRRDRMKWAVYTSSEALTGAATGLVAATILSSAGGGFDAIAVATLAGAFTAQSLDTAFASITARLRGIGRARDVARMLVPVVLASVPLYAPVVALLVYTYSAISPWTLPLFLVPALAAQRLYALYQDQRTLAEDLVSANSRLERANLSFASALVATLDARDQYTAGHSAAVAIYAEDIARRMGLPEEQQQLAKVCGLVHDIGKVGLPPGLLEKNGPLTLEERRQMERHSAIGERILAKVDDYSEIARVVRHHHERVDGGGYPDRLVGDEIPLLSRIIAVADAYNAMTSDRPYRDAMPSRVARFRMAQAVESQFDTSVVAAFEAVLSGATEEYRSGTHVPATRAPHAVEPAKLAAIAG